MALCPSAGWQKLCCSGSKRVVRSCRLTAGAPAQRISAQQRRHRSGPRQSSALSRSTFHINEDGFEPEVTTPQTNRQIVKARQFFGRCEFLYSAAELRQHPVNDHAVPEILVMGASNVGKSSLLNSLFGRRDMARASKEPGKTTLMNAYGVGKPVSQLTGGSEFDPKAPKHGLILMDTPGYGFGSRNEWGQNIMTYIEKRKALRGALVLISAEKKLNDEDRWLLRQLASASTRITVVLTRADKLGGGLEQSCMNLASQLWKTAGNLERSLSLKVPIDVYAVSSHSIGQGDSGGIGGLRPVILDMAGIALGETKAEQTKESIQYTGKVVSFDDIQWKT